MQYPILNSKPMWGYSPLQILAQTWTSLLQDSNYLCKKCSNIDSFVAFSMTTPVLSLDKLA